MPLVHTPQRQQSAVERNFLVALDVIAQLGNSPIDCQAPFPDPVLYFAPRPVACGRQEFLDALSQPGPAIP